MHYLTQNSQILIDLSFAELVSTPVRKAIQTLKRDMRSVLMKSDETGVGIRLEKGICPLESFKLYLQQNVLVVQASDALGVIYGLYAISKELLGIHEFWFWCDQHIEPQMRIGIPEGYRKESEPFTVRYRGWFINDEVLLNAWCVDRDRNKPWEMAFEALLRCGGNMVIPGTDKTSAQKREVASDMGLTITHHHAEPLGAEMFSRAYPGLEASYDKYPELFEKLWNRAIALQRDMAVIWNLGFRGQGDCPFWQNDPKYSTDALRGELISQLIRKQYAMVKEQDPDGVCCTNLYGEILELYQKGVLDLPEDIIKVWADNGYGKMVSRRQGNHNPRIPSLSAKNDGRHGIYYHVSFYDLQAANHITMLTNTGSLIQSELEQTLDRNMSDFWIINCSNIKPHVFYLDAIAQMWRTGALDVDSFRTAHVCTYFGGECAGQIAACFAEYERCSVTYGPNEDDHAGEQFPNHGTRILTHQWIKDCNSPAEGFLWANDSKTLSGQMEWYGAKCSKAADSYSHLVQQCCKVALSLDHGTQILFEDSIMLHSRIYAFCYDGARNFVDGFNFFVNGNMKRSFYCVGKAAKAYAKANKAMCDREHGKWNGFYANECLTDIRQTVWVLQNLMAWIRMLDDGPHFYQWKRDFLYSEADRQVMLLLTTENHLTDQEIFRLMQEKWER